MSEDIYVPSEWGARFHALTTHEALGAGAAGPGKTTVLIHDPLAQVDIEHKRMNLERGHPYRLERGGSVGWALHLRRTGATLDQTIAKTKREFPRIDPGVKWSESRLTWEFSSGYRYQFGHCKDPDDWENYMSNEYCAAGGTEVLMGDGSYRAIEEIEAGMLVQTLAGPRSVTVTWDSGVKPCVRVTTRYLGETVGTQVHPTTHPVLLWPSDECGPSPLLGSICTGARPRPHGLVWQDYESLLYGRPESPVERASAIAQESGCEVSGGEPQDSRQLPPMSARIALHGPTVHRVLEERRSATGCHYEGTPDAPWTRTRRETRPRQPMTRRDRPPAGVAPPGSGGSARGTPGACGATGGPTATEKRSGSRESCSSYPGPHDAQPPMDAGAARGTPLPPDGAASRNPSGSGMDVPGSTPPRSPGTEWSYPHFYSAEVRPRQEEVLRGEVSMEFCGWHQTYDLTVDGENHYITRSGIVNAQTHLAFDELTQFDKEQYDQISTRVRTSDRVLRRMLKIRSMSNPLMRRQKGETFRVKDQKWVQRYFVDPAPEGEKILVRTLRRRDGRLVKRTRIYLPATLYHNPDKGFVEDYEERLLTAPKHIQQALLYGNWDVTPDSFYADSWDPMIHVIEPFTAPKDWRFFRSMDWGFRQPGCVHWWAMNDEEELFILEELTFQEKDAAQVAEDIKGIEINLGLWDKKRKRSRITGIADTQLWEKRGDVGKSKAQTMREKGIFWRKTVKGAGSRQSNAERVVALLKSHEDHTRDPRLLISRKCRNLIRTLPGIQTDPHNANEPEDGGEDHWHDSLCYGVSFASRGIRGIPQPRDDDDDYEAEAKTRNRGRYGYGQEVC